jgi:hypothetical protein
MQSQTYQISLDFEQILSIVRQLPSVEQDKIRQEIEKANREQKLNSFLTDFHTDEISLSEITAEVEAVCSEIYCQQQNHA